MKNRIETVVTTEENGLRLDVFVPMCYEGLSRNYAQILIDNGCVSVNGAVETVKKRKIKSGDVVCIDFPEPRSSEIKPQNIPIKIVYEDDDVVVVDKPAGMVVHPSPGNYDGTLVNAIMYHCGGNLSTINGQIRPGIVHRIDKDTSGLLMVAKNDKSHESLAAQLKEHSVVREYTAIVCDNIKEDSMIIDAPIGRSERDRLKQGVFVKGAKDAVTHIKVIERFGKYTLISARLETGRTHQIRVHMAYKKHPLLGDTTYGSKKQPFGLDGQLLHAGLLGFVHPSTGEYLEFASPLPEKFEEVLCKIRNMYT